MSHPLDTLMNEEIKLISNGQQYSTQYAISCTVHSPNGDFKAIYVSEMGMLRDYVNRFSDVITITGVFGLGHAINDIAPFHSQLECTVVLKPVANVPTYIESTHLSIKEYRYRAILYETNVEAITNNRMSATLRDKANLEDVVPIRIQLVNPLQESLRSKSFGGVIRDTNPMDAIRFVLTKYSKEDSIDKKYHVTGVDVQPGYGTEIQEHMSIPHLSPVIKVPKIIEQLSGGIYPTGMSYYLQGTTWYVWSPFDTTRYEKAPLSLTVINIPNNKLPQLEKTFRKTETQLILLSTGKVVYNALSDKTLVNESHGVRFVDGRKILDGIGKTTDNKLIIDSKTNVNEVVNAGSELQPNTNKNNGYIRESAERITSNYYQEYTKIAMRKGAFLQLTWENSADDLIIPGMPIRFIYMDGKLPAQTYGTVVAVESSYLPKEPGIIQRRFANKTVISCFVDNTIKNPTMK